MFICFNDHRLQNAYCYVLPEETSHGEIVHHFIRWVCYHSRVFAQIVEDTDFTDKAINLLAIRDWGFDDGPLPTQNRVARENAKATVTFSGLLTINHTNSFSFSATKQMYIKKKPPIT